MAPENAPCDVIETKLYCGVYNDKTIDLEKLLISNFDFILNLVYSWVISMESKGPRIDPYNLF